MISIKSEMVAASASLISLYSGKDFAEESHEWPDHSTQDGHARELSEYN